MKKLLTFLLACSLMLALAACSDTTNNNDPTNAPSENSTKEPNENVPAETNNTTANITLDTVIKAFEHEGIEVDREEKPMYSLISAEDGVIFYIDGSPVKLYEFASESNYEKGIETLPSMEDYPKKGLVVLESSNDTAIEIFNSID